MLQHMRRDYPRAGPSDTSNAEEESPWLVGAEDVPRRLVAVFSAFGPAYLKWLSAQARAAGITYPRMRLLHLLQCRGPQIMSALREELGITARSVTSLVDGLEAEGLVRRVPHPTDRRATLIESTDRGGEIAAGLFEAHSGRAAELFAELPPRDQQTLLAIMEQLVDVLSARTAPDAEEER